MKTSKARALTLDDLAAYSAVREPLSQWLRDMHGRGGWRAGWLGLGSTAAALIGMHGFGVSPMLVLTHALLALTAEGLLPRIASARLSTRPREPERPFRSPGHALAFARGVIAAMRGTGQFGREGLIVWQVLPGQHPRDELPPRPAPAAEPQPLWVRILAPFVWSVLGLAWIAIAALAALIVYPVLQIAATVFDAHDWWGLALLLALNLAQFGSIWRELHAVPSAAPWQVAWLVEPPTLSDLVFWRQYKVMPLAIAMVVALLMVLTPKNSLERFRSDPAALAIAVDARMLDVATAFFVGFALLYAVLLAAPWHARRLTAALDSISLPQR